MRCSRGWTRGRVALRSRRSRRSRRGRSPTTSPRRSSPGCGRLRSRRSTATSSRRASRRQGAWEEIDFNTPLATRLRKDWSYLGIGSVAPEQDERARAVRRRRGRLRRGRRGRRRASSPTAAAACCSSRRARTAPPPTSRAGRRRRTTTSGGRSGSPRSTAAPVGSSRSSRPAASAGRRRSTRRSRCASRDHDYAKWHDASGLLGRRRSAVRRVATSTRTTTASRGASVSACDPTGARACTRSSPASARSASHLEPVHAYTDANCMSCGSCLQGCPTNAGKSTMNTYIHDAWATGRLELRAEAPVQRVVVEDGEATGVEYVDGGRRAPARGRGSRRRRRGHAQHTAAPAALGAAGQSEHAARRPQPRASIRSASSTGCSTSRRTRTWCTRSPPMRWTISATRTEAS